MRTVPLTAFLFILLDLLGPVPARPDTPIADSLAARGVLGVPVERARLLESELGQLFIVNVDGFGASGPLALEPDFAPLIGRLQVGGVIPHYGSSSYLRIRRTNRALAGMTRLPLLVCCDIVRLRSPTGGSSAFGDGYIGGFIGKFRELPDSQFQTLAELNAFVFAALGMNVALGPTVDDSTRDASTVTRARVIVQELRRFGLQPVLKHFPFLPRGANLHRSSPDTRVPLCEAERRFAAFRDLAGESHILMTTHLNDSLVDTSIATFSTTWIGILARDTGFSGLLMSDGLLMLRNYADRSMLGDAPVELARLEPTAAWAARAILAGHDFIIVEGSARQTERAFRGVLGAACSGGPLGNALADRIQTSFGRIRQFKLENEALLSRHVEVPSSTVDAVIAATPREGVDLRSFRFDAGPLDALEPQLARAAVPEAAP
jgi:beta-glucosidase-like glycosyl hydrolase